MRLVNIPIVFVGGPFSAETPRGIELNIQRAEALALEVGKAGAYPVCPNLLGRAYDGDPPYDFWLEATKAVLRKCDAVVLVSGWEKSGGVREEVAEAERLRIPVFTTIDDLKEWLANKP